MNKCIVSVLMLLMPLVVSASGGAGNLDKVYIDLSNQPSLQRGARTFVNYCLSCHNASFMRYERMATDLGISEALLREEMMFASDKPGDLMVTAMPPVEALAVERARAVRRNMASSECRVLLDTSSRRDQITRLGRIRPRA